MTMGERIREIRRSINVKMTQTEFGNRIGVAREVITSYEIGRVTPPEPTIRLICNTFGVNYQWLKDGIGPMYLPPNTADEMVDEIMAGEDEFAKNVFRAFARLGDEEWLLLKKIVDMITNKYHEPGRE